MVSRAGVALLAGMLANTLLAVLPAAGVAQARAASGPGLVHGFLGEGDAPWSALAPLADLPRAFPARIRWPLGLLTGDAPRQGLFWNGANPGGLPFEVDETRSLFGVGTEDVSGDYHRPFDPGRESRTRAAATGWRPLGSVGAGIATATVESGSYRDDVHSEGVRPYSSNPYVVADTFGSDLDQFSTRLEAAGGWRLGEWGVGVAAGFQGQETRTVASPVPRRMRSAGPGVGGGVVRQFAEGRLRLGVFGRWQSLNETMQVYTVAAPTQIYQIAGYFDPRPASVTSRYFRNSEREAWTLGGGASGSVGETAWTVWGHRAQADERYFNEQSNDPRSDLWRASSTTLGAAASHRMSGGAQLSATLTWTDLEGEAEPPPPVDPDADPIEDPVTFRVDERTVSAVVDLRIPFGGDLWNLATALTFDSEVRVRRDQIIRVESNLDTRALGISAEVVRALGRTLAVSAGAALVGYDPVGGVPNPAAMGPEYRRWIGPELTVLGSPASTRALVLGGRWDDGSGRRVWLRLTTTSMGPGTSSATLPQTVDGRRSAWTVAGGVVLRGR